MADKTSSNPAPETQASRRLKYGLNVLVAVLAALALVVLINWIAYRQYVRFDWTATRKYSLSEQTEKVLANLEGDYRVVMLFPTTRQELVEGRDLILEYGRYARDLDVQYINPDVDVARQEVFFKELLGRYRDGLEPTVVAIEQGREALSSTSTRMAELVEPLRQAAEDPELADGEFKDFLASLPASLTGLTGDMARLQDGIEVALDQPLPEYPSVLTRLREQLQSINDRILAVIADRFARARGQQGIPTAVQDRLLGLSDTIQAEREQLRAVIESLRNVTPPEEYTQLVESIRAPGGAIRDAVIVIGPDQVRIIDINEMFRQPDPQMIEQGAEASPRFVGEERLTGALLSMSVDRPAMVVFVEQGQQPALGQGGQYEYVAQRLRAANFRVESWRPGGSQPMGPMGQAPLAQQPPPQADEGQQTIWIVPPAITDPRNPMATMMANGAKGTIAQQVRAGLKKDDAALFILAPNSAADFAEEDPLVTILGEWGIVPQLERMIFREVQLPDRRTQPDSRFTLTRWPDALPITQALGGMAGVFVLPSPVTLGEQPGVEAWPLVVLHDERLWAETGLGRMTSAADLAYDPAEAVTDPVIAAAAEKDGARLVVTTAGGMAGLAPSWASDGVTTVSTLRVPGAAYVEAFGAMFPGNAEFFVNSVYWLAGLDELIAASPRSQDIRRIGDISPTGLTAYRTALFAGVPLAIAAFGVGVWLVRRRG